jgi:ABC-2 type transport system ATP-binding protein
MIEVQNISKSFGPTQAVKNVSFSVNRGEVVGFLGPNGAGKSTTMRILTCYLPADEGTAKLAGFDVATQSLEVRRRIGYLPENNPLYMEMGVLESLYYIAALRNIPQAARKAKIRKVLDMCGLEPILSKDIGELSKGFRQRLGLAHALIHDPDIMILDEPTIGLDPNQIIEIRNLIKSIGREKTVILSSHILPEVSATCDRVLIINRGEIVGSGTPEELASMAKGGQAIHATIRGPLAEIRDRLQAVAGVREVIVSGEDNGISRLTINTAPGADLCEEIFFLVSRNNWSLNELYRETITLEDVFRELTREG